MMGPENREAANKEENVTQVLIPNSAEVASDIVDGEAILINVTNGMYYSTTQVGGFVWSLIQKQQSLEDIVAAVARRYEVEQGAVRPEIAAFADELVSEGLAMLVDAPAKEDPPTARLPAPDEPYAAPQLNKFDDMAELFALDPPLPALSSPIDPDSKDG